MVISESFIKFHSHSSPITNDIFEWNLRMRNWTKRIIISPNAGQKSQQHKMTFNVFLMSVSACNYLCWKLKHTPRVNINRRKKRSASPKNYTLYSLGNYKIPIIFLISKLNGNCNVSRIKLTYFCAVVTHIVRSKTNNLTIIFLFAI